MPGFFDDVSIADVKPTTGKKPEKVIEQETVKPAPPEDINLDELLKETGTVFNEDPLATDGNTESGFASTDEDLEDMINPEEYLPKDESEQEVVSEPVEEPEIEIFPKSIVDPETEEPKQKEVKEKLTPVKEDIPEQKKEPVRTKPTKVVSADETVIPANVKINGYLQTGAITVEGEVTNGLDADGTALIKGKVAGTVNAQSIHIFGRVDGDIISTNETIIERGSIIFGNITGAEVTVAGAVKGNIKCGTKVTIASSAIIQGDVYATSIVIENSASISGVCKQVGSKIVPSEYFDKLG